MTLRLRLMLAFAVLALAIAALYGTLTYVFYQRQQWAQLEGILESELERTQEALANPRLGVTLLSADRSGTVVQWVGADGEIVLPRSVTAVLPAAEESGIVDYEEGYFLTAARPLAGGSTIRVGLDVTEAVLSRGALARALAWLGFVVALLAALFGGLLARSALTPLASLARQARAIDPGDPAEVAYEGPRDEVAEVASALNTALANIRKRREEERAFLSEVAHELAAPLTLVKGHLDAFERSGAPGRGQPHIEAAREAAQELLLTSQDLLVLARGELERPAQNEVLRLDSLLERLVRAYPGVRLEVDGPIQVVGDQHQLLQAIRNLVRNAVQATGGEEGVGIELRERGERVELVVRDSGPGIPPERLERIFERYFSGSTGAGVGLTVVSRVVERHGGELLVDTGPQGSRFTMLLPSFAAQLA